AQPIWPLGRLGFAGRPPFAAGRNRSRTAMRSSGRPVQGRLRSHAVAPLAARSVGSVVSGSVSQTSQFLQVGPDRFGKAANVALRQILFQQRSEVYLEALFCAGLI